MRLQNICWWSALMEASKEGINAHNKWYMCVHLYAFSVLPNHIKIFQPDKPNFFFTDSVERLNCKRPIPICRLFLKSDLLTEFAALCLTDFIDWRYIHSLIGWYFRPSLWTVAPMDEGTILVCCCPSIFSLTSSPPPSQTKCTVYMYTDSYWVH